MPITIDSDAFGAAGMTAGRYEGPRPSWMPGPPEYQQTETHLAGVSGSYTANGGFEGQDIVCRLRWIGASRAAAFVAADADITSWGGAVFAIIGPGGETYARCKHKGAEFLGDYPAGQGDAVHIIDYKITFRSYALPTPA